MAYDYQTPMKTGAKERKKKKENIQVCTTIPHNIQSENIRKPPMDFLLIVNRNEYVILLKYIHFPCPFTDTLKSSLAVKSIGWVFV